MEEATLTSKSQITLPKAVRERLGVGPGDKVRFVPSLEGYRLVVMKGDVTRLRGMFKGRTSKPLTVEEIDEAIAEAVVARDQRSRRRS